MGMKVNTRLMDDSDDQQPKQTKAYKRRKDKKRPIQFVPHDDEWKVIRFLVLQSKISGRKEDEKTTVDIAEEFVRATLNRGKTIINMVRPSPNYLTKGNKINIYLTQEEGRKVEALAILHGTTIKKMTYSLFSFAISEAKKDGVIDEILATWTDTGRTKTNTEAESNGVLL